MQVLDKMYFFSRSINNEDYNLYLSLRVEVILIFGKMESKCIRNVRRVLCEENNENISNTVNWTLWMIFFNLSRFIMSTESASIDLFIFSPGVLNYGPQNFLPCSLCKIE
jgi:hypothetical protein